MTILVTPSQVSYFAFSAKHGFGWPVWEVLVLELGKMSRFLKSPIFFTGHEVHGSFWRQHEPIPSMGSSTGPMFHQV